MNMDGRLKMRNAGSVPTTLGRQVGVLPVNAKPRAQRRRSDDVASKVPSDISIPADRQRRRPPSGKSPADEQILSTKSDLDSLSFAPSYDDNLSRTTASSSTRRLNSSESRNKSASSPAGSAVNSARSKGISSLSSRSSASHMRSERNSASVGSINNSASSESVPNTRTLKSSSSYSRKSSSKVLRNNADRNLSVHSTPRSELSDDDCDLVEQDIRFVNVSGGSSRSSTMTHGVQENGKKTHKTINPEEILAQNMEKDYYKIYEINLHASEITDMDNLEKFRKLKVLDLSCNFIQQIKNLEFNTDLRELKLYDNRLRKIENLENLKELSSLQLQHNKIKNIGKGLQCLKKLKNLRLDCNQLLKIETPELASCVQITVLDISYNMLDSLAALNYLPNLEELNAAGNRLRSVSDLTKCKHLQEVDLSANRITDLSGLRGSPKLQTLVVSRNNLATVRSLGKLKCLQELNVSSNKLLELSSLPSQFQKLEVLDVTENDISDWDEVCSLEGMEELVELFISGNPFCTPDGVMPHYYSAVQEIVPAIEIIDGTKYSLFLDDILRNKWDIRWAEPRTEAHVKKQVSKGAPVMRPMSASAIVSLRQMEAQMKVTDEDLHSLEKSLYEKFDSLRSTCDSLPAEPPKPLFSFSTTPGLSSNPSTASVSRCSRRSRIRDAQVFASQNPLE